MQGIQTGFLLGIGSNIEPERNMVLIIDALMTHFASLSLSKIIKLPPIGMKSQHDFLNVVAFVNTSLTQPEVKAICNQIEISLGRDRTDPDRSIKDRSADLDILCQAHFPDDATKSVMAITDEFFLHPLIQDIQAYFIGKPDSSTHSGCLLTVNGLTLGQSSTTINRHTDTGHKRVI